MQTIHIHTYLHTTTTKTRAIRILSRPKYQSTEKLIAERCSGFTGACPTTTTSLPLSPFEMDAPQQPLVDRKPSVSLLRWNNNTTTNTSAATTTILNQQTANNSSSIRNQFDYIPMTETNRNYNYNTNSSNINNNYSYSSMSGAARQGLKLINSQNNNKCGMTHMHPFNKYT